MSVSRRRFLGLFAGLSAAVGIPPLWSRYMPNYTGPICQHHEYELGDNDAMRAHFKNDLATLREWLKGV